MIMDSLLYVDDEPALLEIGTIFLERTGEFSVTTASGVDEALRVLENTSCDLVISDYQMPERDGIELLQEIRSRYPDLPFILFTGRGREEIAIRAFDLGADFYLQKGGDPLAQFAELTQKVRQAIRRRRAEEALKRREQQLNAMATNIPGVVYRLSVNPDGTIGFNYISERSRQILGLENEPTTIFDQFTEQIVQEDRERFISSVRHAISTRTIWEFEGQYIKPSGKKIWISAVSNPLVERGRLVFDGVIFNNTGRKRAEENRRLSEEYYHALFQYTESATIIIEDNGIISRANEAFADLWGEPSEAIEGILRWTEFIAPDDLERVKDLHFQRRISPDEVPTKYEFRFVTCQGFTRDIFIHFGRIPGTRQSVASLLDITELKQTQEALILDEKRLEALVRLNEQETATIQELVTFAMDEMVQLTRSILGYIALYDEDERILTMYAWSKSAMEECGIAERPIQYPIDETGLWGEAVRQRSPVITNDYHAESSLKKGMPSGHVPLTRHMNVPIFEGDRIVIVAGVGNKPSDYDDADVRQLTLLMGGMWRIIQRKRAQAALRQINKERRT
jgi:PAS domain S-box-containing protein